MKKTRNKFEQSLEKQLKRSRVTYKYESERIPYILARHYIPDFVVNTITGKVYIEAKGYLRPDARAKMVAVKKLNPHLDIRIVFYAFSKKNIAWANRHGFRYAIRTIPKEWLEGM